MAERGGGLLNVNKDGAALQLGIAGSSSSTSPVPASESLALIPPGGVAPNHARRLVFIDVTRGIAATIVMCQHGLEWSGILTLGRGSFATDTFNAGITGVALFFLVSGFIIPASTRASSTFYEFWVRRIFRIYPLYLVIFVATLAASLLIYDVTIDNIWLSIGLHMFLLPPWVGMENFVGGSWTLLIEFAWYFVFSVAAFSRFGAGVKLVHLYVMAFIVFTVFCFLYAPTFPLYRVTSFSLCFWGYLYYLRYAGEVSQRTFALTTAAFALAVAWAVFVGFREAPGTDADAPSLLNGSLSYAIALLGFPLIMVLRESAFATSRILSFLGEISYSIYLVHSLIYVALNFAGVSGLLAFVTGLVLTLIVSLGTYMLIEKPGIELGRRLTPRKPKDYESINPDRATHQSLSEPG